MTAQDRKALGVRLRAERDAHGWGPTDMARRLREVLTGRQIPDLDVVVSYVKRWEAGKVGISRRYRIAYALVLAVDEAELFGHGAPSPSLPARSERRRTPAKMEELLHNLDEQWHILVKADNEFGPLHALDGVRAQLVLLQRLLGALRPPLREWALRLAGQYAESAAWLYEDAGDLPSSRLWTGRAMEWALEAGDRPMVAWTMFRRSQQARTRGNGAQVVGLAEAARREQGGIPGPMLAAILQQQAHGIALDGDEMGCHMLLDRARTHSVADDAGDARAGHGAFCTPAYLEMQRGHCWLTLGRPARAVGAFEAALRDLSNTYQRDRGIAYAGLSAALVEDDKPEAAARQATRALTIAQDSGSARILSMVTSVSSQLSRHTGLEPVAALLTDLSDIPGV